MRRLYFLLPDVKSCEVVIEEIESQGVAHNHIHVIASVVQDIKGLPEATIWQKTELAHGIEWGVGLGGTAGLLGTMLVVAFPPAGLVLGGGSLIAGAAAGAGLGAVMMGLMKTFEHNHDIDDFKPELDHGEILLMVDVPKTDVEETTQNILKHHPEVHIKTSKISK